MINRYRFLVVYALLILVALFINLHRDITVPMNRPFAEFPQKVQSWRMISEATFGEQILAVLKPTDYISRQYKREDGKVVNLYIGYHGGGKESGEIHSPKHCLPGSGWYEVATKRSTLQVGNDSVNLVSSVYQQADKKELFLYWFQVRDKTLSDEYSLKLAEITGSMLHRRRDASFIRISVPFEGDATNANIAGETFIRDFVPVFREFLPG